MLKNGIVKHIALWVAEQESEPINIKTRSEEDMKIYL